MIAITQNFFYVVFEGAQNNLIFSPKICILVLCNHDIHKTCAMFAEKGTTRCFLSRNGSFSECCASCAAIQVLAGGQSKRLLQDKLLYMFCTPGPWNCLQSALRWEDCTPVATLSCLLWHLVCRLLQQHICHAHTLPHQTPHTHTHTTFFMVYAVNLKCTNYVPSLIIFLSVLAEKWLKNKLIPNILPQANCVATSFCDSRISFLAA